MLRLSHRTLAAGMALCLAACSWPLQRASAPASAFQHPAPTEKITQLGFGQHAAYGVCAEPACPAVTRKTLAMSPPGLMPFAVAPALEPSPATLPSHSASAITDDDVPDPRAGSKVRTAPFSLAVRFAPGSATLTAAAKAALDTAAQRVQPGALLQIAGHTDSTGSRRGNVKLAAARARAVHDYLATKLPTQHPVFTLAAKAACCFIASNATASGRSLNRRVEIVLGAAGQAPP